MIMSTLEKYFPVKGKRGMDRTEDSRVILTWEQLNHSGKIINFLEWLMNVFAIANTRGMSIKLISELMMNGECVFDVNKWVNHIQFVQILHSMVNEEYLTEYQWHQAGGPCSNE